MLRLFFHISETLRDRIGSCNKAQCECLLTFEKCVVKLPDDISIKVVTGAGI